MGAHLAHEPGRQPPAAGEKASSRESQTGS